MAPVEILVTLREKTGSVEISTLYCVDSGGSEGLETGTGTSQRLAVASENCSKYKKEIFTWNVIKSNNITILNTIQV